MFLTFFIFVDLFIIRFLSFSHRLDPNRILHSTCRAPSSCVSKWKRRKSSAKDVASSPHF